MAAEPGKGIMVVNEFESSNEYRLQQIMHTLENVHGVKLDFESNSVDEIRALGESSEIVKNSIVKESAFNTAMQNPEYTKNMLILEAVRLYLAEIAPKRMKKKAVKEGLDPANVVKIADFGRKMMDYAQKTTSTDDKELRVLNAISQVGDKLTQVGTPFGPKTLTDMDKRVIEVARRRMSAQGVAETVPGQDIKLQPGMLKVKKDGSNQEEVIDAKDLANKQRQGFQPVSEDDELNMLFQKYGITEDGMDEAVDQDGDGDNDGADVMIARMVASGMSKDDAIAKTKNKPYNKESMMEAAGTKELHKLTKKKKDLEDKMDKIVKDGGKMLKTDPLRKEYEKVCTDLKKAKSKKIDEAVHMEQHDDYQASMARSELYRNTKYAMDMLKMIGPDDEVKPWIAANLTKAASTLDKIYHYMDYHMTFEKPVETPEVGVTEEEDLVPGDTGSIARQNLMMVMEYSTKLFRMIHPGDKLEGWVAMKLTTASEAISCSKHHLDYIQFEKHAGEMMDMGMGEPEVEPIEEVKGKKSVKEASIANILMSVMLNEEQDLAQAETLLAAKAMSDELQGMAEKLAKMSVEDLMPIVDTMKEQFGQESANGFNDTIKGAIESALNSITQAKDTTDNSILSLQQGGVPGVEADIETTELPDELGDIEDEFGATPAASGEEGEPLGRAKKDEEVPGAIEESAKKAKPDFLDVDGDKNRKESWKKAEKDKAKAEKKGDKVEESNKLKQDYVKGAEEQLPGLKKAGWKKDMTPKTGKKAEQARKTADKRIAGMTKAVMTMKEEKVNEVAPPGKKAEDFIKGAKEDYKKRYGDRWEEVLYRTAWKKFGPKKESIDKMQTMLEVAKQKREGMRLAFEQHKVKFAKMVAEGAAKDLLKTGYGLEGQTILEGIADADTMIKKLRENIQKELNAGAKTIAIRESKNERAEKLTEAKNRNPFGVFWKGSDNKKHQKFFESEDLRTMWMDLNKDQLAEHKLVNPQDFDQRIGKLTSKKG